jgi:hypothetical protein
MTRDPAIEEIRSVRRAISAKFNHDIRALLDHYRELEKRDADRMLRKGSTPRGGRETSGLEGRVG